MKWIYRTVYIYNIYIERNYIILVRKIYFNILYQHRKDLDVCVCVCVCVCLCVCVASSIHFLTPSVKYKSRGSEALGAGIVVSDFCSSNRFGLYFCSICSVGPFHASRQ